VNNGVQLLTRITAAGCSLTALIAAFLAAAPEGTSALECTAAAMAVFGCVHLVGFVVGWGTGVHAVGGACADALLKH